MQQQSVHDRIGDLLTKHKWLIALGILILVCIGSALLCFSTSSWERAYSRIELGMTRQEVETAIGMAPGYYEGEYPRPLSMSRHVKTPPLRQSGVDFETRRSDSHNLEIWHGQDYVIWVLYDEQGTAVGSYLLELDPSGR